MMLPGAIDRSLIPSCLYSTLCYSGQEQNPYYTMPLLALACMHESLVDVLLYLRRMRPRAVSACCGVREGKQDQSEI